MGEALWDLFHQDEVFRGLQNFTPRPPSAFHLSRLLSRDQLCALRGKWKVLSCAGGTGQCKRKQAPRPSGFAAFPCMLKAGWATGNGTAVGHSACRSHSPGPQYGPCLTSLCFLPWQMTLPFKEPVLWSNLRLN